MKPIDTIFGVPVYFDAFHTGAAEAKGFFWRRSIVVGPLFVRESHRVQRAILLHEVSHCIGWHLEKRIACIALVLAPLFFLPLRLMLVSAAVCALYFLAAAFARSNELAADAFAAEQGYGADLLEWLKRQMPRDSDFYPRFETRCDRLTRAIKEHRHAA